MWGADDPRVLSQSPTIEADCSIALSLHIWVAMQSSPGVHAVRPKLIQVRRLLIDGSLRFQGPSDPVSAACQDACWSRKRLNGT